MSMTEKDEANRIYTDGVREGKRALAAELAQLRQDRADALGILKDIRSALGVVSARIASEQEADRVLDVFDRADALIARLEGGRRKDTMSEPVIRVWGVEYCRITAEELALLYSKVALSAAELFSLRAQNEQKDRRIERLRKALEPFASDYDELLDAWGEELPNEPEAQRLTREKFKAARAALESE